MTRSNKTQIKSLLAQLKKSTDQKEKKAIRAKLRKLGHLGGLKSRREIKRPVSKKKTTKKSTKKTTVRKTVNRKKTVTKKQAA